jgi:hypothetical protein
MSCLNLVSDDSLLGHTGTNAAGGAGCWGWKVHCWASLKEEACRPVLRCLVLRMQLAGRVCQMRLRSLHLMFDLISSMEAPALTPRVSGRGPYLWRWCVYDCIDGEIVYCRGSLRGSLRERMALEMARTIARLVTRHSVSSLNASKRSDLQSVSHTVYSHRTVM